MSTTRILASHLALVLTARRVVQLSGGMLAGRWAAMGSTCWSPRACDQRRSDIASRQIPYPPLFVPMTRGNLRAVVDRTSITHGLAEVRRTWGTGLRALRVESASELMR